MPSRGINTLSKHQLLMGCRFENCRQSFFERQGNRQKALEAYRNSCEMYERLQTEPSETEGET